jgi:hypothetical protein
VPGVVSAHDGCAGGIDAHRAHGRLSRRTGARGLSGFSPQDVSKTFTNARRLQGSFARMPSCTGVTQNLAEMGSLNRSLLLSEWYRRRPPPPPQGHQDCAFSIPVNLPHQAGNPRCCTDCSTTVRLGGYDDTWVDRAN